jgi:DNA-binding GntR family transcriptional regulator
MVESMPQPEFLRELASHRPRRDNGMALHWQCADVLRHVIEKLHYPAAVPLPPEKELAEALGVSRPTLRHALARLANDGVVHSQRGVGTFALRGGIVRPVGMSSLFLDLLAAGRNPATRVLRFEYGAPSPEAERTLGVAPDAQVLRLERVRTADGVPVALTRSELALPDGVRITAHDLENDGLYPVLHRVGGIELVGGSQIVGARRIRPVEAEALSVPEDGAVLIAFRTANDARGRVIEHTEIVYPEGTELLINDLRGTSLRHAGDTAGH